MAQSPYRRLLVGVVAVLLSIVAAAPAAADSLTVTADPTAPWVQAVHISTVSANPGEVAINVLDKATPCPAPDPGPSYPPGYNGPPPFTTFPSGFRDENSGAGSGVSVTVPAGSWSGQAKVTLPGTAASSSHLCAALYDNSQQTETVDAPVHSYASVNPANFFALIQIFPTNLSYHVRCSAGSTGITDDPCPMAGHLALTVSRATRRKLHLSGRTIYATGLKSNSWGAGADMYRVRLTTKLPEPMGVPVTLKVTLTSPVARTFSYSGKIKNISGSLGVVAATYAYRTPAGEGER